VCVQVKFVRGNEVLLEMSHPDLAMTDGEEKYWERSQVPAGFESIDLCKLNNNIRYSYQELCGKYFPFVNLLIAPNDKSPRPAAEPIEMECGTFLSYQEALRKQQNAMFAMMMLPEDEQRKAIVDNMRVDFEVFQYRQEYSRYPACTFDEYSALRLAKNASNTSGSFAEYYEHYQQSAKHVVDGKFTPEFAATIGHAVDVWSKSFAENPGAYSTSVLDDIMYWGARNFEVHDEHLPILKAFVEARLSENENNQTMSGDLVKTERSAEEVPQTKSRAMRPR
jgi:hypothetical protein